jgi:serine/threonine protein kinase
MELTAIGRYEILGEIGKGAMGVVYRANDPMLSRVVAIKTVNMSSDPEEVAEYEARFYQEAKAAGGLNHPNIVTVHDIGKSGNLVYMAMEFLEGQELRDLMKGEPLPVARAVEIAAQVADGLGYAHQHGVVHRDIKPANIMILNNGPAKITDFGIARMRSAEVRTQTGVVLGSPRYMSPEQVAGRRAEPRSDIFSLGVIFYEMLTGKAAFAGEDITSVMYQILNVVPPPPSSVNPAVPQVVDFIVAKTLAKTPEDRYQNATELARDLHESAKSMPAAPPPPAGRATAQPKLDARARAVVRSLPGDRRADVQGVATEPAPALGLSKAFNSMEATMKLAAQTGMADALKSYPGGHAAPGAIRRAAGWTAHDKMIFAASVAGALAVGAVIILA